MKKVLLIFITGYFFIWLLSKPTVCMEFLEGSSMQDVNYSFVDQNYQIIKGKIKKGKNQCIRYKIKENSINDYVYLDFGNEYKIYDGKSAKIIVDNDRNVVSFKEYKKPTWLYRGGYLALVALYLLWCLRRKKQKQGG